ncbi:MAG TPA: hemerythrin family protein [Alphaproteobacteria bacterium]|nr:hemerythrin family protein [Alphaproteobacteria bacterium]
MTMPPCAIQPHDHNESLIEISNEHVHLVALLEALDYCFNEPVDDDAVGVVLDELLEETRAHFMHEEDLMYETGYLKYLEHQADHRHILGLIEDLIAQHRAHTVDMKKEARWLIEKWMADHFEKFDRDLIVTISEKF